MTVSLNSLLGMARDWDIFSVVGLLVSLWALCLWKEIWGKQGHKFIVAATVGVGVTCLVGWVGVNVSSERASTRFKDVLRMDEECVPKQNVAPGYENLRKYYQQRRLESEEYGVIQKLIEYTKGDPAEYDKLFTFVGAANPSRCKNVLLGAIDNLSGAVERSKRTLPANKDSSHVSDKQRFLYDVYTRALISTGGVYGIDIGQQADKLRVDLPRLPYGYELSGWHHFFKGNYDSSLASFHSSYSLDTSRINTLLGKTFYWLSHRYQTESGAQSEEGQALASKALYFYEKALGIQPKPWLLIDDEVGYLYLFLGNREKAREYFQRYLEVDNSSQDAEGIKRVLSYLP
jgi:tetratricopeptide (TPR) repeat protein